jgi:hypothetical protein
MNMADWGPGPVNYIYKVANHMPYGRIGTAPRLQERVNPDSSISSRYAPVSDWNKNQRTIATKRDDRKGENNCSSKPGFYFPEIKDKGTAFYISGKNKKKHKRSDCPGLGTYSQSNNLTKPRSKSAEFSIEKRYKDCKSCQLGPGNYNVYQSNRQRPQSAKFRTAKKIPILNDCTLGPGSSNNWDLRDQSATTFGTCKIQKATKKSWDPDSGAFKNQIHALYEAWQNDWEKEEIPFNRMHSWNKKQQNKNWQISCLSLKIKNGKDLKYCDNKCKPASAADNPSYDLVLPFNSGKTIAEKRKDKFDNCEPGPGSNNIKVNQGLACFINQKFKDSISGKEWKPGPDVDNPGNKITKAFSSGKTVAVKHKEKMCDSGSNQGEYGLRESDTNKGLAMGDRPKYPDLRTGPGPGANNVETTLWQKSDILDKERTQTNELMIAIGLGCLVKTAKPHHKRTSTEISNLSQFENVDEDDDLLLQQNTNLGLKPNASKIKKSPLPSVVDDSNEYGEILKIRK